MLLRYQDFEGRGPWRPGLSQHWMDDVRDFSLPAVQDDFDPLEFVNIVNAARARGLHIGTAVRGRERLAKWFTASEQAKLAKLGFRLCDASRCEVLAESDHQVLIASATSLAMLPLAVH